MSITSHHLHPHPHPHRFIAPGDREQYLYRIQELLFTDTRAISDIFKVRAWGLGVLGFGHVGGRWRGATAAAE